jgi:Mg2+-importing ATPase
MPVDKILLGSQIEAMSEGELAEAASLTSIFAKLAPAQKEHIIHALQSKGRVVGFMGDGINAAPAESEDRNNDDDKCCIAQR